MHVLAQIRSIPDHLVKTRPGQVELAQMWSSSGRYLAKAGRIRSTSTRFCRLLLGSGSFQPHLGRTPPQLLVLMTLAAKRGLLRNAHSPTQHMCRQMQGPGDLQAGPRQSAECGDSWVGRLERLSHCPHRCCKGVCRHGLGRKVCLRQKHAETDIVMALLCLHVARTPRSTGNPRVFPSPGDHETIGLLQECEVAWSPLGTPFPPSVSERGLHIFSGCRPKRPNIVESRPKLAERHRRSGPNSGRPNFGQFQPMSSKFGSDSTSFK